MATHLKEGQKAPGFTAIDQHEEKISLPDFRGKKVALYFYPKDDTPTCTAQACNLRDNYNQLLKQGIQVIGVSPDEASAHRKFREKYDLPFPLIADPEHKIINKYGVWGEKQMFGNHYMGLIRTTFLIDEEGNIQKIFNRPKSAQHAQEIIESLGK
ncbi:MAG: thioredoxin-dependent thiol peroxidase [Niabella sp.]